MTICSDQEKALAATLACEKCSDFVLGKHTVLETNHKALVPILGIKDLDQLSPRILRFRLHLHLNRFNIDIMHVPGKELYSANSLSRFPVHCGISVDTTELQELAELCVTCVILHFPACSQRLDSYPKSTV